MTPNANPYHKELDQNEISNRIELIQQWQYAGRVHPLLMEDRAFKNLNACGLTSVQSYVTWAEIERQQGIVDFSSYDPLVEKLCRYNIKWVPFLILGPAYATPPWFKNSPDSVYAECLEHGKTCRIQSIWNPHLPKFVDHFLELFSRHYSDPDLFESISLGISGNWGESIFPAFGGFMADSHVHPGWWCGDRFARKDFQQFALKKYNHLSGLNKVWGTDFKTPEKIDFPHVRSNLKDFYFRAIRLIPFNFKPFLKRIKHQWGHWVVSGIEQLQRHRRNLPQILTTQQLQYNLDFVEWYQNSMTKWASFWLKTARRHFPDGKIYLVAGGEGEPMLGADFAALAKIAADNMAGIRTTNQTDNYAESFIRSRLVASACRHYKAYFTTEEAGINRPEGVTMRLFDAVSSGASGVYFKSIIGTGQDACAKIRLTPGEPTKGAQNLASNRHFFKYRNPIIDTAIWFPQTTIAIYPLTLDSLYSQCQQLRTMLDFDLVDERMILDDALSAYRFFVFIMGRWMRKNVLEKLRRWIERGGILVAGKSMAIATPGGDEGNYRSLFSIQNNVTPIGDGYTVRYNGSPRNYLQFISTVTLNPDGRYPWKRLRGCPISNTNTYSTLFDDVILSYDLKAHDIRLQQRQFPT